MTELEQLILDARLQGVPLEDIVGQVESWAAGAAITGVSIATAAAISSQLSAMEPHQVSAFTDLLLSRVERATIVDSAQEFNPEVLFAYFGPADGVTRDFCLDVLSDPRQASGWTTDEILSLSNGLTGNALTDAGGYRCRHTWRPIVPE